MIATRELYWAAGFLEGEGCFLARYSKKVNLLRVTASQVQREPLERLQRLLGGYINPQPVYRAHWQPVWCWQIHGSNAAAVMMTVYTIMSPRRREQITNALTTWRLAGPRSALRTHCPQGHPYDEANTIRGTNSVGGPARWCRQCRRDRKRLKRSAA